MSDSTPSRKQKKGFSSPPECPNNGPDPENSAILLSSLLEYYLKSRFSSKSGPITDDMFSKLSVHFSNIGVIPAASGLAARSGLSFMRQSSLDTIDRLLLQAIEAGVVDSPEITDPGPSTYRNSEGGGEMFLQTEYPSFGSLLGGIGDANPDLADNPRAGCLFEGSLGGVQARGGNITRKGKAPAVSGTTGLGLSEAPGRSRTLPPRSRYSCDFAELGKLGMGGFGVVFRARNYLDGVEYAVKKVIVKRDVFGGALDGILDGLQKVTKEVKILASLQHPNVVRYFGSWVEFAAGDMIATLKLLEKHGGIDTKNPGTKSSTGSSESNEGGELSGTPEWNAGGMGRCSGAIAPELPPSSQSTQGTARGARGRLIITKQRPTNSNPSNAEPSSGYTLLDILHPDDVWGSELGALYVQMSLHLLTLRDFVARQPNPIASHCFCHMASLKIFLELAQGVEYLHSQGIAHRDLKPANIFLDLDRSSAACGCVAAKFVVKVKIGDFGIAKYINDPSPGESPGPLGDLVGGDIFSLGILLFELVYPAQGYNKSEVLWALMNSGKVPSRFKHHAGVKITRLLGGCCGAENGRWEIPNIIKTTAKILAGLVDEAASMGFSE